MSDIRLAPCGGKHKPGTLNYCPYCGALTDEPAFNAISRLSRCIDESKKQLTNGERRGD